MSLLDTVNAAIGTSLDPITYRFTKRDTALYALGVGAPSDWLDADELKFVYELNMDFCALPTMPVIYSGAMIHDIVRGDIQGIQFNPMMLVHGEQSLTIKKAPLPVEGTITCTPTITDIYDKGSGMLIVTSVSCVDEDGAEIAVTESSMFIRGLGGFGGERGPSSGGNEPPERKPDATIHEQTLDRQALIYRLSGDINPLHADPSMAALGNFDRPILQGLATFGFAARAVMKQYAGNDPANVKGVRARFSKHVFPGDTLITDMWETDSGIIFQVKTAERRDVVLSHAYMML